MRKVITKQTQMNTDDDQVVIETKMDDTNCFILLEHCEHCLYDTFY